MSRSTNRGILRAGDYREAESVSRETSLDFTGCESLTRQSFKEDADINVLVAKFGVTELAQRGAAPATHAMFDDIFNFQSAMNSVVEAQRLFMALDAKTRKRFGNSPHEFVEFCSDPSNSDEMIKLGLAIPLKVVDTTPNPDVPVKEKVNVAGKPKERKGSGGKPPEGSDESSE